MQKKQTIFLVLGLSVVTLFVLQFSRMSMGSLGSNGFMGMMGERYDSSSYIDSGFGGVEIMPSKKSMVGDMMVEPAIKMMPPYYYGDDALDVSERSYEQSSYHSVVVTDVSKYLRGMKEYFSSIDGVVLNSNMNSSSKYESGSLYVKVPVDKFDETTQRVTEDVKKVVDESINANDITGQVVNVEQTLTSLEEQKALKEAQLLDAKTEVEKKRIEIDIARLDRQIVAAQKNQDSVESRVEYSSVMITAASNERYFNPDASGDIRYEFERAWESLKSFVKVVGLFGVWILVYSLVWAPVVWIVGKVIGRIKK